ncbi:MAG: hypothetical protein O3A51_07190 [Verrucomicrobia bacterium]|nr:hypothetical protein [Verrucomicrobiota bacterium]
MSDALPACVRAAIAMIGMHAVLTGTGLCMLRCLGRRLRVRDVWLAPWLGWADAIAFLQIWHGFRPVNGWALGVVVGVGLLCNLVLARTWLAWIRAKPRACAVAAMVLVAAACWLTLHSVRQPGVYDSGLYHLNAVRWAGEFAIVPGLGNLHGRLAFNNSSLLFAALLDVGPFAHRSHQLASALLMLFLLVPSVLSACRVLRQRCSGDLRSTYYALLLAPLVCWIVTTGYASSPSPDVPVFLLGLLIGGELLALLDRSGDAADPGVTLVALACLAWVGVTVKLSFVVFGLLAVLMAGVVWCRRAASDLSKRSAVVLVAVLGVVTVGPWLVRGIMLSGYPAYPSTMGGLPVDWAIGADTVAEMAARIQAWARLPHVPFEEAQATTHWFSIWLPQALRTHRLTFTLPLATLVISGVWMLVARRRHLRAAVGEFWPAIVPTIGGLAFWFVTAPDPRFQGSILWVLGLTILCLVMRTIDRCTTGIWLTHAMLVVVLTMNPIEAVRPWVDPTPARQVDMEARRNPSGLLLYLPVNGDQCWDSPLPATPYYSTRLHLREPGNLAAGFSKQLPADAPAALIDAQPDGPSR